MYFGKHNFDDPLISPLYGDYRGFPPLMITIGTNEIHLDDGLALAEKAKASGVDVELDIWENMVHAFVIMSSLFPEAKQAMTNICQFIKKHLN